MGKLYSDTLYKYKDSNKKKQNNQEIKPPVYKSVIPNLVQKGIVGLFVFLIVFVLLEEYYNISISLPFLLLIYGSIFLALFSFYARTSGEIYPTDTAGAKMKGECGAAEDSLSSKPSLGPFG